MNIPARRTEADPVDLACLARSLASSQNGDLEIKPTASMKTIDKNGATAWKLDGGSRLSVNVRDGADTKAALQSTLQALKSSLSKPSPDHVEDWLVELDAITAKRATDAADLALRLTAYRNRLCEYPEVAVKFTLLVQRWKFWPTWAELGESLDAQLSEVSRMIVGIERELSADPQERVPTLGWYEPTEDQKAKANAIVNKWKTGNRGDA